MTDFAMVLRAKKEDGNGMRMEIEKQSNASPGASYGSRGAPWAEAVVVNGGTEVAVLVHLVVHPGGLELNVIVVQVHRLVDRRARLGGRRAVGRRIRYTPAPSLV